MTLAVLSVHGQIWFRECKTPKEAKALLKEWVDELKKSYPNYDFKPIMYSAKKLTL